MCVYVCYVHVTRYFSHYEFSWSARYWIQDEESEEEQEKETENDTIANELFEGFGDVLHIHQRLILKSFCSRICYALVAMNTSVTSESFKLRGQMFGTMSDLLRWFKKHFRNPVSGRSTSSTLRGAMTSRTPYTATSGAVSKMNQEAIQRAEFFTSHVAFAVASGGSDTTSLSATHAEDSRRRQLTAECI